MKLRNDNIISFDERHIVKENFVISEKALEHYAKVVRHQVSLMPKNAVCSNDDLFQEGMCGVVRAFRTYNESKGASLNTWVNNCVRFAILNYLDENFYILSGGQYLNQMMEGLDENFTVEDMMKRGVKYETAVAATYYKLAPSTYGPAFNMIDLEMEKKMEDIEMSTFDYRKYLTDEETTIIEYYFGLAGREELSMREIGEIVGKSRKSVSYSINKSLTKLRYVEGIEDYYFAR